MVIFLFSFIIDLLWLLYTKDKLLKNENQRRYYLMSVLFYPSHTRGLIQFVQRGESKFVKAFSKTEAGDGKLIKVRGKL